MRIYLMRNSRYYNKIVAAASRTEDVTSDSHIVVYKEDSLTFYSFIYQGFDTFRFTDKYNRYISKIR